MSRKAGNSLFVRFLREVSHRPRSVARMERKRCSKCGQVKPLSEFYKCKGGVGGVRGDCKECFSVRAKDWYGKNREHVIARVKQWRAENLDRARETERRVRARRKPAARADHLMRTFGITQADYEVILASQGGGCAICGDEPEDGKSLHVDHLGDIVRGILCVRCNNALGQLKERVDLLERAADYVDAGGFAPAGVYELQGDACERARALRAA
jgi:hypothetical protein